MEFAKYDREGFLGLTEVVRVASVDNFFDYWLRLNHFTPSALIALNGSEQWSADAIAKSARSLQDAGLVHTPTFLDDALNFYNGRVRTDDVPLLTDNYAPIDTMVF